WATTSTGWSTSWAPVRPSPTTRVRTPSGRCPLVSRASSQPVAGVRSLGLYTTVLPVTRAAPSSPHETATGSFHGVIAATTPRGRGGRGRHPGRDPPRGRGRGGDDEVPFGRHRAPLVAGHLLHVGHGGQVSGPGLPQTRHARAVASAPCSDVRYPWLVYVAPD